MQYLLLYFFLLSSFLSAGVFAEGKYFTKKSLEEILPGRQNAEVKRLQEVLYDFGYYKSEEDEPLFSGRFEVDLQDAIKDFQTTNNIRVSGRADFNTLKTINEFLKFQSENSSFEEGEEGSEESNGSFVANYEIPEYSVEEKNYFDEASDITDLYNLAGKKEDPTTKNDSSDPKNTGGIFQKIKNALWQLFMPSEKYREQQREKYEAAYQVSQQPAPTPDDSESKRIKFEKYDYFECLADDECIKYVNEKSQTSK